jgi:hypothetical protein
VSIRPSRGFLARHWIFGIALALGAALRLITWLGFRPAIWFGGDSVSYVNSGLHWWPGVSRESGYGVMLELLEPFHSFAVVTAVQHVLGLAIAVMIYALLRQRYRLPAWGATAAALPVLLDVYVIQLEQEILADSTFAFLCAAAVTLVLWWPDHERPRWSLPVAAALLGIASTFWPVGLPLLIVLIIYLLIRRFGWRAVVSTAVAAAVPLLLYLGWFGVRYHRVAFNESDGIFLWSRTMTFADCAVIKPPAALKPLCPAGPPSKRPPAPYYIWESNSPLLRVGGTSKQRFTPARNALAQQFAIKAIEAQPLSYADVVLRGWLLTFSWDRPNVPSAAMADRYQFSNATQTQNALSGSSRAAILAGIAALHAVQRQYTHGHTADTRAVQPFADIMINYQRFGYLRGTMIGVLMLIGLGGIVRSWRGGGFRRLRGWGGPGLFPWLAALTMQIVPPATANFSLRYVVPTIPIVCLTAALAFARPLRPADQAVAGATHAGAAPAGPDAAGPDAAGPDAAGPDAAGQGAPTPAADSPTAPGTAAPSA